MDPNRFDALTKAVAGGTSRRDVLRRLAAGLLTALVPATMLAKPRTQTISCKVKEKIRDADGNPIELHCEVECPEGAGYCVVCGTKEKHGDDMASCAAACCTNEDPTQCVAPDKKDLSGCKQGRVKTYKG